MTDDVFGDGKGFVKLCGWIGSELEVVNAARVSFHKESEWTYPPSSAWDKNPVLSERDAGLIRFLLKNRHGTPFEHGFMSHWHIRLPIFVMREWVRHRIGHSINEESGRYVELRPDFYIPGDDVIRTQVGKPGAYSFEQMESKTTRNIARQTVLNNCNEAWERYRFLLDQGVAKEQARIVLPLNLYTEIRWTANARSLMNFLSLRNHPDAMWEIQQYAEALESQFAEYMPVTYRAFIDNGRIAP